MWRHGRKFYTEVVEHFLRMGVRCDSVEGEVQRKWHKFTTYWIDILSDEDKKFIKFVFSYIFRNTDSGLNDFPSSESLTAKRKRLDRLEMKFAIDAELIPERSNSDLQY